MQDGSRALAQRIIANESEAHYLLAWKRLVVGPVLYILLSADYNYTTRADVLCETTSAFGQCMMDVYIDTDALDLIIMVFLYIYFFLLNDFPKQKYDEFRVHQGDNARKE